MIFYFTGTGNSYAAALRLQEKLGGELTNITDCMQDDKFGFDLPEDEPVGIVFPVYYGGLPSIVNDFLDHVRFSETPAYIYGVMTFGGNLMGAGWRLEQKLKSAGLSLSADWGVKMPANYAILYEPTHEDAAKPILEASEGRLDHIAEQIRTKQTVKEGASIAGIALSTASYPMYDKARKTGPFHVDDRCVSCGVCAGRCPVKAIEMRDGTPTWVKDECVFCMSCLRCNAIQYGSKLEGRYRYRHPIFKKKSAAQNTDTPSCH
ncbi:MAG: EFR1 family ferrodoxin [Eubacterium sp.]|nr:EFR1 family ferrodoxin [Eubacterium sp.]